MIDCNKLIHPFQNDPGVSQNQRMMAALLTTAPKIDERTLADLLDYFTQVASDINFYDNDLQITDWKNFFSNSFPFLLASIIKTKTDAIDEKFTCYNKLMTKNPSPSALQLNLFYTYYVTFKKINTWHLQLKNSKLPIALTIAKLISTKLKSPFIKFAWLVNAAVKYYCVKKIDFTDIINNPAWEIQQSDLFKIGIEGSFFQKTRSNRKKFLALQSDLNALSPVLIEALKTLGIAATQDLHTSITTSAEELADLQKKHDPHLALIFVFLKMFEKLRNDLNGFTKKHLDFFYQEVLQLKPQGAVPDKANILLQLQNQVQQYLVKKGTQLKDGKDNNKAEILFSLDDEIVVNKTQVADVRTLFLNNQTIHDTTYFEGVYMAPDATKADGVTKDFAADPKNYPTVGAQFSKYIAPGKDFFQPYPNARLGFILASPVLLLSEGLRTVTITLSCKLADNCGETISVAAPKTDPCCPANNASANADQETYPDFIITDKLYNSVSDLLSKTFVYITEDLIQQAEKKGIPVNETNAIRDKYLKDSCKKSVCCETKKIYKQDAAADWDEFWALISEDNAIKILADIFPARKGLKISFSGEKEWIVPDFDITPGDLQINLSSIVSNIFSISIIATIKPDQKAITFYNKDNLKEDFNTTQPLAKIELDDHIKIPLDPSWLNNPGGNCCLDKDIPTCGKEVSLYNFFRSVVINDTTIKVQVCGLKNFIVQNDESVQDVNSLIYPFGTRPKIGDNFFIGSEEIFLKRWSDVWVNVFWKNFPSEGFAIYYNGYQYEYRNDKGQIIKKADEISDDNFLMQASFLQDGKWLEKDGTLKCKVEVEHQLKSKKILYDLLFPSSKTYDCFDKKPENFDSLFTHQYHFAHSDFNNIQPIPTEKIAYSGIKKKDANTRQFFLKFSLKCQDFQHDKYPIILGRQLTAAAKLPELTDTAVYYNINSANDIQKVDVQKIFSDIDKAANVSIAVKQRLQRLINEILVLTNASGVNISVNNIIWHALFLPAQPLPSAGDTTHIDKSELNKKYNELHKILHDDRVLIDHFKAMGAVIPNEPWTPIISNISLDYKATATIEDIDLIHLYPYDGTYMQEEIQLHPTLFPTFCDEGTLFVGLKDLVPGENVNILFQLAEATSDSETDPQEVYWFYLVNNSWQQLREKFEVLNDDTDNLTTSGIIKFSFPENISADNTIMPKNLFWIKACIPKNSGDVSETIGIHTQAINATFTNDDANDKLRLNAPLPAGSVSKLQVADANIKTVDQHYDSFGGAVPELQSQYYVRVSELLRHKGRAIQKFDYERLALQAFPQIFKAKCINHSFALNAHEYKNDFPFAPGYVLLAVIPDLNKLQAGNSFQPKAPVSMLEEIEKYLQSRTSPFVRFRAMNPRYEAIHFCITVKLLPGKDRNYYQKQVAEDIQTFMAPWAVGDYYKLTFGQCVSRSDIIQFLETRDYVDYILQLKMTREDDSKNPCKEPLQICPATPRSILIAGNIDVCIEPDNSCETWDTQKQPCENKMVLHK